MLQSLPQIFLEQTGSPAKVVGINQLDWVQLAELHIYYLPPDYFPLATATSQGQDRKTIKGKSSFSVGDSLASPFR